MPNPEIQFGDDSRPDTRPIYGYIVNQIDTAIPPLFLTGHDGEFDVSAMPANYDADSPQTFTPANIGHGPIRREGNFDKSTFELRALTNDITGVSRYVLTGAIPKIRVDIIKINPGRMADGMNAEWGEDTILVQTGLVSSITFQGFGIMLECVPQPLFSNHEIPRWRFTRTCNHQLFGKGCGLEKNDFKLEATITATDIKNRILTVNASITPPTGATNHWKHGYMAHDPSGLRLPIQQSANSGGTTILKLHQWSPDIEVGDTVKLFPGCNNLFSTCRDKFSNAPNFGGFSHVPNKNPSAHGIN